ncbi:MAG: UDP-N-acetylmuramoyl-L-alanine--D-glutamate ligase [Candidatus Moranbacteria bacterium]|nr:UDP-N-acetylmuramoyl-L-alanine--D-glutamate ligase [Candidatus Moranbacteria bacterium]
MDLTFFKNKRVTVFGLGLQGGGVGTVKFLVKQGARVIVTDIKAKEQLVPSLEALKGLKGVEFVLGQHHREDFIKVDMVVKTPPVPWNNEYVKLALAHNIPVEMDSSLFFKFCKNPIIGVTGTKGKTTTATLIYEILKLAGKNPVKVGIGQASVLDRLELLKKDSVVVFELSSWRLSALGKAQMSPHIAVIKNILPDHLNYYRTIDDYLTDKENIFLYQKPKDFLIINEDDERLRESSKKAKSQIIRFSGRPIKEGKAVFREDNFIYLNDGVDTKKLVDIKDIKIPGEHNIYNIMAAAAAAYVYGIPIEQIKKAVVDFFGVPHRLEFVRELRGVRYFNDTAATIPDAMMSALESFVEPIVLIAGGTDKKLDFSRAGEEILKKVKYLVLLKGDATEKLLECIGKNLPEKEKGQSIEFEVVDSMQRAVELASQKAEEGDVVLLSPGAASFGLFLNEFDRGDKFREAVNTIE